MRPRVVKKLKWREFSSVSVRGFESSPEPYTVGVYTVSDDEGILAQQITSAWHGTGEDSAVVKGGGWKDRVSPEEIAAHKLLCQKHFEKRILSCLTAEARRKLGA